LNNLRTFSGASKLKQAALAFIASHLTRDDERRDLDKIFKEIDIDGDGNLSKEEILLGYEKHFGIPISEEQVDDMFRRIDLDGNGTIDYTEFVMATMEEQNLITD
jgi:calcium-dependent protein kinase